jgi:type II secretory pathway pseudopilin PulG
MSTGALIAVIVVALLIFGLLGSLVPGLRDAARRRAEERELKQRRQRAEARLHEERASLHDEGLADDGLVRGCEPRENARPDAHRVVGP